jgi:pimeloyl-ACP methyl ester carboxylesterase
MTRIMKLKSKKIMYVAAMIVAILSTSALATTQLPEEKIEKTSPQKTQRDTWKTGATQTVKADGVSFAYRELGKHNGGTPIVFLTHLAAVLDNWDPKIMDDIAVKHHVIAFDNRGIGASSGSVANSIEQMGDDAVIFINAMGFKQVDLLGLSMGGMIAQEIVLKEPKLVRKIILAGTGPAGGKGISSVAFVTFYDMLRGFLTGQDAKQYLFFTRSPASIEAGKAFLGRINERTENRDTEISVSAFLTQLRALYNWGRKQPADLSVVKQPVLVVNGDDDRMVPTSNTHDLASRFSNSTLVIYRDAGHGAIFQYPHEFVAKVLEFLAS